MQKVLFVFLGMTWRLPVKPDAATRSGPGDALRVAESFKDAVNQYKGTYTRRQTQPDAVRRKSSRRFSQEKWSDRVRRNQTQKSLENLKTAGSNPFGVRIPGPP